MVAVTSTAEDAHRGGFEADVAAPAATPAEIVVHPTMASTATASTAVDPYRVRIAPVRRFRKRNMTVLLSVGSGLPVAESGVLRVLQRELELRIKVPVTVLAATDSGPDGDEFDGVDEH